jgi:hypothetical protein
MLFIILHIATLALGQSRRDNEDTLHFLSSSEFAGTSKQDYSIEHFHNTAE